MQIQQWYWTTSTAWGDIGAGLSDADLVFAFADSPYFQGAECFAELRQRFPKANILGCSSAGNVLGARLTDDDIAITAVKLEQSRVRLVALDADQEQALNHSGKQLLDLLQEPDLRHIFILSDGQRVNGSDLAKVFWGLDTPVSGGLAGDGTHFGPTWVMANAPARNGRIAALGIYGNIQVKSSCVAGWHEFGTERIVTRSSANIVMEIDHQPALALYKKYLGDLAADLPSSGLRFPLSVTMPEDNSKLVRTLLSIDEAEQSLRFAGDVPQGAVCRLMRTQLDDLIESAAQAAQNSHKDQAELCLLVSCVGRRLILGQLAEEELEAVLQQFSPATRITGFYSYGELAPHGALMNCQLHNQTMTLTTLRE